MARRVRGGVSASPTRSEDEPELSTVRLALLELAHRHDFSATQVIDRALELEAYVLNGRPEAPPTKADKPEGPAS